MAGRIAGHVSRGLFALLVLFPVGLWASLALWFRIPGPAPVRALAAAGFGLFALVTILRLWSPGRWRALAGFALAFAALLVWWSTIKPPENRDWAPEVGQQVTGEVKGDVLTLTHVRDFDWSTPTDYKERWTTESYDLSKLREMDVVLAYWTGPLMTHPILTFGFDDGRWIAWSVEVRKTRGGDFSPIADLFRNSALVILAAKEHDVVRLRTNIRKEEVYLYRLNVTPEGARALLLQYVEQSNSLAAQPRFYNSLTTNCTTALVPLVRAAGGSVPLDWRLIVNGFLPEWLYDRGSVDTRIPLDELRARSRISERALAADGLPDFSARIREGVPSPWENVKR
jgi:hypothetical protein